MPSRRERVLKHIDPARERGLEIGPLARPLVRRDEGHVRYVDHATTAELREKYRDAPGVALDDIPEIDYVWGERTLAELTGGERFDYCVAQHVVEHVPDLVGWLKEIAEVLVPGGRLALIVPDKRFTFDYWRPVSTVGDALDAWREKRRRPSFRNYFDQHALSIEWTALDGWSGRRAPRPRPEQVLSAREHALRYSTGAAYHDQHCWVFTPRSFVELFEGLVRLGLVDYEVRDFEATPVNYQEFYVTLTRLEADLPESDKMARQLASLPGRVSDRAWHWKGTAAWAAWRLAGRHAGVASLARRLRARGWV